MSPLCLFSEMSVGHKCEVMVITFCLACYFMNKDTSVFGPSPHLAINLPLNGPPCCFTVHNCGYRDAGQVSTLFMRVFNRIHVHNLLLQAEDNAREWKTPWEERCVQQQGLFTQRRPQFIWPQRSQPKAKRHGREGPGWGQEGQTKQRPQPWRALETVRDFL